MLQVKGISAGYGGRLAIRDVSVEVSPGEVRVILGANAAGKSTLLRSISGLTPVISGDVLMEGKQLKGKPPHEIAAMGIGHCLQGRRIFPFLSVKDNLELGAYLSSRRSAKETLELVLEIFPVLKLRMQQKANTLSGGERQMLCIGQTLMSNAKILLLDEPSAGLSPILVEKLARNIRHISQLGTGVLWAEQNARIALEHSDFAYLLSLGAIVFSGESRQVQDLDIVKKAYLGR